MPNSPNWHHKNCLADSKEYLWWDLGSQRIDSGPIHLFSIILREFLGIMYSSREYPNLCESDCKFQRVWEVKDTGKYWGPCMFPLYFDLCSSFFSLSKLWIMHFWGFRDILFHQTVKKWCNHGRLLICLSQDNLWRSKP